MSTSWSRSSHSVQPEYRRRGIASALKLRTIEFARAHGFSEIRTENDTKNVAILRINAALGFRLESRWIIFEKRFESDWRSVMHEVTEETTAPEGTSLELDGERSTATPSESLSPDHILELGLAFWNAKVLLSAVELGLFSTLAAGPLTGDQLRERLGVHPRGARDFFDALVALGLLERTGVVYRNSLEANAFLDTAKEGYVGGWLEMANARLYPMWSGLTDALRTGERQSESRAGGDHFAVLYADQARMQRYLRAMTGLSLCANRAIARAFPWQQYSTFADLGAGEGGLPVQVALEHQHLRGIGADLAPVEAAFNAYVAAIGLGDRVRFQPLDLFVDPLPTVDVLVMGHLLHNFDADQKQALIARAYDALPTGGALLIYESLIDDERRTHTFGLLLSLHMLLATPAGADYTGAEACDWLRRAGFRHTRVEHLAGTDWMVVGLK